MTPPSTNYPLSYTLPLKNSLNTLINFAISYSFDYKSLKSGAELPFATTFCYNQTEKIENEVKFLPQQKKPTSEVSAWIKKHMSKIRLFGFGVNVGLGVVRKFLLFVVAFLLLGGAFALGIGTGYFASLVADTNPPSKEELEKQINDYDEVSKIVYSDGSTIATISTDLIRTYIPSKEISAYLKDAIIATEDENFETHNGVVPKALARAVISDITGLGGSSGGSTLTQQLVKQQILTSETTFKRKANEILLALRVDKFFTKDEIITSYLNVSPFGRNNKGQNIAGVEEAAEGIFGHKASELTLAQAAFIAGLPQSPIVYSPYTSAGELKTDLTAGLNRKDIVLFSMYREKIISKKDYEAAKAVDLTKQFLPKQQAEVGERGFLYFTVHKQAIEILMEKNYTKDGLTKEKVNSDDDLYNKYYETAQRELQREGYIVTTTVDPTLQNTLDQAVKDYGYVLDDGRGSRVENGGVLMDNHSGRVYGFIGGRDFSVSQNNHAFDTTRPPGSTIKPVLAYGPAVDVGLVGTQTMLSNFKTFYKEEPETEIWNAGTPPDNTFHSTLDAITNSLNIPAYHLYQALLQKTDPADYMKKMEYDVDPAEFHNESSPLGQMDMTVFDQTKGFATLANGGAYNSGYIIDNIKDTQGNVIYQHKAKPTQVYAKSTASIMNYMMRNVYQNGTGRTAYYTLSDMNSTIGGADWVAKTGTSTENKDFWFIGSTPGITFSSWIGYDDGTPMDQNNGTENMKYWAYVVNRIYSANQGIFEAEKKFDLDPDVVKVDVSNYTGEKLGNFTNDGKTYVAPGSAVTSYYAKGFTAGKTSYEFAIGGKDADYKMAWNNKLNLYRVPVVKPVTPAVTTPSSSAATTPSSSEETKPSSSAPAATNVAPATP